jgi:hypothetical protein
MASNRDAGVAAKPLKIEKRLAPEPRVDALNPRIVPNRRRGDDIFSWTNMVAALIPSGAKIAAPCARSRQRISRARF